MFDLIDRIKKTVALCFDPQGFGEAANNAANETFKSVEAANKKLVKTTKKSINWYWQNVKRFVLAIRSAVSSVLEGICILPTLLFKGVTFAFKATTNLSLWSWKSVTQGFVEILFAPLVIIAAIGFAILFTAEAFVYALLILVSALTSNILTVTSVIFASTSYLGAFSITTLLGFCLVVVGILHGIAYPSIILPYQVGAFLVNLVRQIELPTWKRPQPQTEAAQQAVTVQIEEEAPEVFQPEVITNNPVVLVMPSNLNDEKIWTEQMLIEYCDLINSHYPDSISNHHFPGIKRRSLTRKIKDFFLQRQREASNVA